MLAMPISALASAAGRLKALVALPVALVIGLSATNAQALSPEQTMTLCREAAVAAADRNGVPREVMLAITQVETRTKRGGRSGPWPWTVNVAGKGAWFDSRAAALLHAQQALRSGEKSFDVGCFQLNYRWHGEHFPSIDAMFEPGPAGDYAARFLKELYAETGDWMRASGNYHSRTPVHATRYRNLVANAIRRMGTAGTEPQLLAAAAEVATPDAGSFAADTGRSVARVVAPLVVRAGPAADRTTAHMIQVRAPRGTGRIDGSGMVLRAPAPEVLALR